MEVATWCLIIVVCIVLLLIFVREYLEPRLLLRPKRRSRQQWKHVQHLKSGGILYDMKNDEGQNGDPRRQILILHGIGGSADDMVPLGEKFQRAFQCRVFLLEYRGFGQSRYEHHPVPDDLPHDLREAWKQIPHRRKTVVCGFSMGGGTIGQWLRYVRESDMPRHVILMNTYSSLESVVHNLRWGNRWTCNIQIRWMWWYQSFMKTTWNSKEGLKRYCQAMQKQEQEQEKQWVTIIATEGDRLMSPAEARRLHKWTSPHGHLIVLPQSGHFRSVLRYTNCWVPHVETLFDQDQRENYLH